MMPPHLPPKSCSIAGHRLWQRLKIIFAFVICGLIVSMSGASIILGWVWPRYAEQDTWITSYSRPSLSRSQLEDRVRQEISTRILSVYQSESNSAGVNYLKQKIGDAIVVSSDGWIAMYKPDFDGGFKGLAALSQSRQIYQFENYLLDRYAGVLYLKIKGAQLDVVNFSDSVNAGDTVFVFNGGAWYGSSVGYPVINPLASPHLDTAPVQFYPLDSAFASGDVAIGTDGRVAGLLRTDGTLLPSPYITRILPDVLSRQAVDYVSLGTEGWFSEEAPIVSGKGSVSGFAVTRVLSADSKLRRGDVILQVNGRVVSPADLWYNISGSADLRLTVLRNGKSVDLQEKAVTITK